jgi:hypothetical protein
MRRPICFVPAALLFCLTCAAPAHAADALSAMAAPSYPSLHISGFGDFSFYAARHHIGDSRVGFQEGQFVLHFVSELGESFSFFGETTLSGGKDDRGRDTYGIAIERTFLRYAFADWLIAAAGRIHTPVNWWNVAFHHGQWLQTTARRPDMVRFGGEFVPVHLDGLMLEGTVPVGVADMRYQVGLGNGRGFNIAHAGQAGNNDDKLAYFAALWLRPDALYDLQVGFAYYLDEITTKHGDPPVTRRFREWIASAHVIWTRETPEVITEFAHAEHTEHGADATRVANAVYAQLAWRLPWWDERLKPYGRFEWLRTDDTDVVYTSVKDLTRIIGGLRIDVAMLAALKLEYQHDRRAAGNNDVGLAQVSFAF